MINEKLMKSFSSNTDNPAYSIIIQNINAVEECNADHISFDVIQINKSIDEIKNALASKTSEAPPSYICKTLHLKSILTSNDNSKIFSSGLMGYSSSSKKCPNTSGNNINNHSIECVITELQKEINIEFNNSYKHLPGLIFTIDEKTKELYDEIQMNFEKNGDTYIGVNIIFTHLKHRTYYPEINILIIGDEYDNSNSE